MPNQLRPHEVLIKQFMQGDPVPIGSEAEFFTDELERLSKIGQLATISSSMYRLIRRDIDAFLPFWFGEGCFVCSKDHNYPLWFFFEKHGPRRWLVFRTKQFFCRQLTWEESDAIAVAVRIRAPRRPNSEAV
jgi:hypothetical protein